MKKAFLLLAVVSLSAVFMAEDGCEDKPQTNAGVQKAEAKVQVDAEGFTIEQKNIKQRLEEDNKPGAIKHLYVISPYSGQVILYSTVRGKVTSGGKRLSPTTVTGNNSSYLYQEGHYTDEVLQDDGTYGSSGDYLYWWDVRGVYHQHYLTGGQIVHVSSQPISVKNVILNLEEVNEAKDSKNQGR